MNSSHLIAWTRSFWTKQEEKVKQQLSRVEGRVVVRVEVVIVVEGGAVVAAVLGIVKVLLLKTRVSKCKRKCIKSSWRLERST